MDDYISAESSSRQLVAKLAKIMAQIKYVPKRGRNEFHKYDYATEADIAEVVRHGLAEAEIMMVPSVREVAVESITKQKGGVDRLVRLVVDFTVTDGVGSISFTVVGEGQDSGDKASYKAMTGATKYALLKLFLIPTGDDPEKDSESGEEKAEETLDNKEKALVALYQKGKSTSKFSNALQFYTWIHEITGKTVDANTAIKTLTSIDIAALNKVLDS